MEIITDIEHKRSVKYSNNYLLSTKAKRIPNLVVKWDTPYLLGIRS